MPRGRKKSEKGNESQAKAYRHTEAESPLRPDVGTMIRRSHLPLNGMVRIPPVKWGSG